ncbi:hypothetical protein ACQJBY_016138 [Aegilops geniculata]
MSMGPSHRYLRHGRDYLVELVVEVYPSKEEQSIRSRQRCLACLCAVTLISASGPTFYAPNGFAADMTNKPGIHKAVCRNCGGGGAIIILCYYELCL